MTGTIILTFLTLAIFIRIAAQLYRGSFSHKLFFAALFLIVGYKAYQYQNSLLFTAAKNGELLRVERLISWGARIHARNYQDETPLHLAAGGGNSDLVRMLLKKGADPNATSQKGYVPLHYAAAAGHKDSVLLLLEHKADLQAKSNDGHTPLYFAQKFQREDLRDLLTSK